MKLVKQSLFLIGVGSLICAIAIAVISTLVNPHSAVLNKYEKALNEKDGDLLAECMDPSISDTTDIADITTEVQLMLALMGINGEAEFEILVAESESGEETNTKTVPAVIIIRVEDKIVEYSPTDQTIIEVDGKEYLK